MKILNYVIDKSDIEAYAQKYFSEHPRARKYPIAKPIHPSINEWMIMRRPQMNELKGKWKEFIVWWAERRGCAGMQIQKCEIMCKTFYDSHRRHDNDNNSPKFIMDGLVESGVIVDDDNKHVTLLSLCGDTDIENPRTEITIKIYE